MIVILNDTVRGKIVIPLEKLEQINDMVRQWLSKTDVSRRQLQSILGLLLCLHKCIKLVRVFLLDLLRSFHASQRIFLTPDFKRDLQWFATFLPQYNGVSLYANRQIDMVLDLDAYLTGFGGRCGHFVYTPHCSYPIVGF